MKNKKNNIGVTKGKKINTNKIIIISIIILTLLIMLSRCKKVIYMDEEKCAEVALEYMEEKYGKEFEIVQIGEKYNISGPLGYAEVYIKEINGKPENKYVVTVYPRNGKDVNKDGYYDKYKVVSDSYMCLLLKKNMKKEINGMLYETGLKKFEISSLTINSEIGYKGVYGFSSDFSMEYVENSSLEELLYNNNCISIYCDIYVSESEYNEKIQQNITNKFNSIVSDNYIYIQIFIFEDEYFDGKGGEFMRRIMLQIGKENK